MLDTDAKTVIRRWGMRGLVGASLVVLAWGSVAPALGQDTICCMELISVHGNWFGAIRTCNLGPLPPEKRAEVCRRLKGCQAAAKYCSVSEAPSPSSQSSSPAPGRGPAPGATHRTYENDGSYTDWYNAENPPPGVSGMTPGSTAGVRSDGSVTVKLGNGEVHTYPPGGIKAPRLQRDDSKDKTNPGGARRVLDTVYGVYTVDDAPADGSVPSYGPVSK